MKKRIIRIFILLFLLCVSNLNYYRAKGSNENQILIVNGQLNYDKANEMLSFVNEERESLGLQELKMDEELLDAAMERAAEIAVYFSHTRPNGESCFTISDKIYAENIAAGNITASSTFNQWKNSLGHYTNMINENFTSIGIGCFSQGSMTYWVQVFGYNDPASFLMPKNKEKIFNIETKSELIELSLRSISDYTLIVGESGATNVRSANKGWEGHCVELDNSMVTYESSDPSIVEVDDEGNFYAHKKGVATISIKCLDQTFIMTVTGQYSRSYFEFETDSLNLKKNDSYKLNAMYSKTNICINDELYWISTNPQVATVDEYGNVKAIGLGSTIVRGYFKENDVWFGDCQVTVNVYTGWLKNDDKWYYYDSKGDLVTGWLFSDHKWYYLSSTGEMCTQWQLINGKWYYFNNDMKTGWIRDNNKWYYLDNDGAMVTGWKMINGKWYYLNNDMKTGWIKDNNKWYYLSSNGEMLTSWQKVNDKWYYLNNDMKTGWQLIDNKWYYLNQNGVMLSGWQKINGSWYYLNNDMKTGWIKLNNIWYYLESNGKMVTGTHIINGQKYYFDQNGRWLG